MQWCIEDDELKTAALLHPQDLHLQIRPTTLRLRVKMPRGCRGAYKACTQAAETALAHVVMHSAYTVQAAVLHFAVLLREHDACSQQVCGAPAQSESLCVCPAGV